MDFLGRLENQDLLVLKGCQVLMEAEDFLVRFTFILHPLIFYTFWMVMKVFKGRIQLRVVDAMFSGLRVVCFEEKGNTCIEI